MTASARRDDPIAAVRPRGPALQPPHRAVVADVDAKPVIDAVGRHRFVRDTHAHVIRSPEIARRGAMKLI
jgi:hypothetical protein